MALLWHYCFWSRRPSSGHSRVETQASSGCTVPKHPWNLLQSFQYNNNAQRSNDRHHLRLKDPASFLTVQLYTNKNVCSVYPIKHRVSDSKENTILLFLLKQLKNYKPQRCNFQLRWTTQVTHKTAKCQNASGLIVSGNVPLLFSNYPEWLANSLSLITSLYFFKCYRN